MKKAVESYKQTEGYIVLQDTLKKSKEMIRTNKVSVERIQRLDVVGYSNLEQTY